MVQYNIGDVVRIRIDEGGAPAGSFVQIKGWYDQDHPDWFEYDWDEDAGEPTTYFASYDAIEPLVEEVVDKSEPDVVNHPPHYTSGKIEVLDFIEDQRLDYHLGQVVKYVARAGKKDPSKELEDLLKAEFYLKRKIKLLEESSN